MMAKIEEITVEYSYRPTRYLTPVVMILFCAIVVFDLMAIPLFYFDYTLTQSAVDGRNVSEDTWNILVALFAIWLLPYLSVTICLIVTYLVWIRRASMNAHALGVHGLAYSPGWCVGCWFIPLANLLWPYRAVGEIWNAADPDDLEGKAWLRKNPPMVVQLWWAGFLLARPVSRGTELWAESKGEVGDGVYEYYTFLGTLIQTPVGLCAAVGGMVVVWGIYKRQENRFANLQAAGEKVQEAIPVMPEAPFPGLGD